MQTNSTRQRVTEPQETEQLFDRLLAQPVSMQPQGNSVFGELLDKAVDVQPQPQPPQPMIGWCEWFDTRCDKSHCSQYITVPADYPQ